MSFASLTWTSAAQRWKLTGLADSYTDMIVAVLIDSGLQVEGIEPGTSYRVDGDVARLKAIAEQLAELDDGAIVLQPEPVPADGAVHLRTRAAPARAYHRSMFVHGKCDEAFRQVARAVDAELQVTAAGRCRWCVTGPTAALAAWSSAHVQHVPVDEVLALWKVSAEAAQAEDVGMFPAPVVQLVLPARTTETKTIKRDKDGQIVEVVSVTKDAEA